jgi:arginyl-tRNA synthetase
LEILIKELQDIASASIKEQFGKELVSYPELLFAEITPSTQPQFGHYQCNSALKIAKALKTSPRDIAEQLAKQLVSQSLFSKVEVAGPGFINLTINAKVLSEEVSQMVQDERLGVPLPTPVQKVIVEFSSPNVAKELHVGHLRSTIIGDSLARLLEFLGHDVLRLNHVGDWGTQFGMLIAFLKEEQPEVMSGEEKTDLLHLMQWYRTSKERFDADADFKHRAQIQVVKLQTGDAEALKAWKLICDISRKGYQEIYDILDVHLIERAESYYNPMLPKVVADLEKKGLVQVSEGAKCIFMDGFLSKEGNPLPLIIQKSDGGYNYATTDMAAIKQRIEEEGADRIILVIGAEQSLHLKMIMQAAEKAGYLDPHKQEVNHVAFGVVLNQEGKKFKTRSGETEKLIDLLMEAVLQAKKIITRRLPDATEKELDNLSKVIGIDAVKYADLSCHRIKDYVFSYERMLKFEGNTAVFLLYSYVRVQGIKRKVNKDIEALIDKASIALEHPSEIDLGLHLRRFGEVLESVARDLLPHRLCDYLYGVAEKFNAFFRDCRVEGSEQEDSRLLLCELTAQILAKGFNLLGLRTVDRM